MSGTPTLGVGPGNVPVFVHRSADMPLAATSIVHSKTFDNGTICASEQALVVEHDVAAAMQPLLEAQGATSARGSLSPSARGSARTTPCRTGY